MTNLVKLTRYGCETNAKLLLFLSVAGFNEPGVITFLSYPQFWTGWWTPGQMENRNLTTSETGTDANPKWRPSKICTTLFKDLGKFSGMPHILS